MNTYLSQTLEKCDQSLGSILAICLAEALQFSQRSRFMNSPFQAERLFARCFTQEQLVVLRSQPEFVDASEKIDSIKASIEVVELGDKILRRGWLPRPSALWEGVV